jgi:NAD(P)-dependent dehydrogenase (short-subunit alcohol dehydrogenase family)
MTDPKVWLVTGASSGLGRAIAEAALACGDTVVAVGRRAEALAELVSAHPGRVHAMAFDLTAASAAGCVEAAVARHGRVDVLVNSAGRALVGAVEETGDDDLRALMELHFFAPVALVRAVLPHMRGQGSGAIVQISSVGGQLSFPGVGAYSATKFALEGLSEALAAEVAPFGITVLIVEPGAFRTGLHRGDTMHHTAPMSAYDDIVGPVRAQQAAFDGTQPGDPAKAAAAIRTALAAGKPPLRLPLGNDAADAILDHLDSVRREAVEWEHLARSTDFDA